MYQYTDCYLDNIWLVNGYRLINTPEGEVAEIIDIDGLHEVMMNMEVGSILKMSEMFQFEWTDAGWTLRTKKVSDRKVA